jgi:hypothetical protein
LFSRLSAFNVFRAKDVVLEKLGRVFDDANSAWGFENVAPLVVNNRNLYKLISNLNFEFVGFVGPEEGFPPCRWLH